MAKSNPRLTARLRRKKQIRKKLSGTTERPRLSVFRSTNHIYAQIVDDTNGTTVAAACTLSPDLKDLEGPKGNSSAASQVGSLIAQKAKAAGINRVVFDKAGHVLAEERFLEGLNERIRALSQSSEGWLYFSTDKGNIYAVKPE